LPRYQDEDESDTFILSESEDLVPEWKEENVTWSKDAFETTVGAAKYTIQRYRPRVEGLFARLEKIVVDGEPGFYWKMTTKDNVVVVLGRTAAARIADPEDPNRIFKWLAEWSYDNKGKCFEFSYEAENLDQVPITVYEKNRRSGLAPFTNTYLKRVRYGNKNPYYPDDTNPYQPALPVNPNYFFEIVCDYGDHDDSAPTPTAIEEWKCRFDPFSDYRPGFEIRTYRLCKRILFFHYFTELNFASSTISEPCLVRSLDLTYRHFQFDNASSANEEADFIVSIQQVSYKKTGANTYQSKSLPPLELTYHEPEWNRSVKSISPEDVINAPGGIGSSYQWIDLYNEGISGILSEQAHGWYYKSNLGNGHFERARQVAPKPSFTGIATGTLQLQDLDADGRKQLVIDDASLKGYFDLTDESRWLPFRSFALMPNVNFSDSNTKLIDLNGDGKADLIVSEEHAFTWYPSLGSLGYDSAELTPKPFDEERGPAIVFADETQSIHLTDMSGDGLSDIVRVRNGEICYWPNLGYGKFGPKVTMKNAPYFDHPEKFNPGLLHLADVSGTGATDILYLGQNKFKAWFNLSGNAWSEAQEIAPFPTTELPNQLSVIDLLGNGTACVVWSSPLPQYANAPMRYVDLMGGKKPYILSGYKNNLGHETRIEYQSSAYYYLQDKQEGNPWVTKLPFPVQCVSKVEIRDHVSDLYFVNEYRYHHGYYDHAEREFRGFGMVEQLDTQTFANFRMSCAANIVSEPLHQPPVLTKTWFHTGAFIRKDKILRQFENEYYRNTAFAEYHLPDAVIEADQLTPDELRQAHRACKGMTLRQEVYALDGSPRSAHPYSAAEHNCHIRLLQPILGNRHAVFIVHESEAITYQYEREPSDPRIAHTLNTLLDEYGNVLEAASVVYGRAQPNTSLAIEIQTEQAKSHITYTKNVFTNDVMTNSAYRLRLPCDAQTFELSGVHPSTSYFAPAEIRTAFLGAIAINYEAQPTNNVPQSRLIEHERTLFTKDSNVNLPLALGALESLGLKYEFYKLAFTPTLLTHLYGTKVDDTMLAESKYIESDDYKTNGRFPTSDPIGYWWIPSGIVQYPSSPAVHFYLPDRYIDPLGSTTKVKFYSDYHLLIEETEDPLANKTTVQNFDFRLLQPQSVRDPNDNITELSFDVLGMVVGMAIKGKGNEADDLVGFSPDLTQAEIDAFFSDPSAQGAALLQHASSRFVYDLAATPAYAASITRETHHQDVVTSGTPSKLQFAFEYSDGSGQVVMKKVQAEPGLAKLGQLQSDGSYVVTEIDTTPKLRWVGNGRTILNNKGKPVMQYEPYFSVTHRYESAPELVEIGVTPVMYYDPVGRLIKTDFPNGTLSRGEFNAWLQRTFDQNDTVQASDWYAARLVGGMGPAEQDAAQKTALHDDTPTVAHLDSLGRLFCTIAHNKFRDHTTNLITEEFYSTRLELDIENNQRTVTDARARQILIQDFDMLSSVTHSLSVDAGERWLLNNVAGKPIRSWDSRNHTIRTSYDSLRRPTHLFVQEGTNAEVLAERSVYGEALPNAETLNLRGKLYQHYEGAGMVTSERHDFKGNLLSHTRQLAIEYKQQLDWSVLATLTDAQAIASPPVALLESEIFANSTEFDALNRPTKLTTPDQSEIRPGYNEANLLERVDANLRGDPQATSFVTDINYDAKGQRMEIDYGNGATTEYEYDEKTFLLTHLNTTRASDSAKLQDLFYTYDPIGNITAIEDRAQQTIYFNNQVVTASAAYDYDAIYRLIEATGREHLGQTSGTLNAPQQPMDDDSFRTNLPHPTDGNAMGNYTERYDYDEVGNILKMIHAALSGSWTRDYQYDPNSNRLLLTRNPSGSLTDMYTHDAHGNMISMPHLQAMQWNFKDHLQSVDLGGGGNSYYTYDSAGERVRKVWEKQGGLVEERIYLGGYEVFRRHLNGGLELERETLHVMDDQRRIALVETKTIDNSAAVSSPRSLLRYQFDNHLGSASFELDEQAQIISYEEYYPYGNTSYQLVNGSVDASLKRYRYTGKERDEESGLYYYGERFYAPWIGRWVMIDPLAHEQLEWTPFNCCRDNPISKTDPTGAQDFPLNQDEKDKGPKSGETKALGKAEPIEFEVAAAFVDYYSSHGGQSTTFAGLSRTEFVDQLRQILTGVSSSGTPDFSQKSDWTTMWFCGPTAVSYVFANYNPIAFVTAAFELYDKGKVTIPKGGTITAVTSVPGDFYNISDSNPNSAFEMFATSLRASQNKKNMMDSVKDQQTMPWHLTGMVSTLGLKIESGGMFKRESLHSINDAAQQGKFTILLDNYLVSHNEGIKASSVQTDASKPVRKAYDIFGIHYTTVASPMSVKGQRMNYRWWDVHTQKQLSEYEGSIRNFRRGVKGWWVITK
jgi:RHS repeat-associated protein